MAKPQDHYKILQVHPSAHPDVIQSAYRRLALLYHPDTNPAPEAVEMMSRLNEAYEVLSDPERRAAYDRQRGIHINDGPADKGGSANSASSARKPGKRGRKSGQRHEGGSVNSASSVREPGKKGRKSGQRYAGIPIRHAFNSAVAILKWQIGFFGRPISVIAGVIALAGNTPLVLFSPFTLPFAIISFFWIWFLGSAMLYFCWKMIGEFFNYLKSVSHRRRRARDRGDASARGPAQRSSSEPAAVKRRPSWKELIPHLAVLGRTAGGILLNLVGFFGWPISIAAAVIMLISVMIYLSVDGGAGGLSPLESGGSFVVGAGRLLILIIGAPVFFMAAFLIWLLTAALLSMACNCLGRETNKPS